MFWILEDGVAADLESAEADLDLRTLLAKCLKLAGVVLLVWATWILEGETADCGSASTEHAKRGGAWTWWNGRGHDKAGDGRKFADARYTGWTGRTMS